MSPVSCTYTKDTTAAEAGWWHDMFTVAFPFRPVQSINLIRYLLNPSLTRSLQNHVRSAVSGQTTAVRESYRNKRIVFQALESLAVNNRSSLVFSLAEKKVKGEIQKIKLRPWIETWQEADGYPPRVRQAHKDNCRFKMMNCHKDTRKLQNVYALRLLNSTIKH